MVIQAKPSCRRYIPRRRNNDRLTLPIQRPTAHLRIPVDLRLFMVPRTSRHAKTFPIFAGHLAMCLQILQRDLVVPATA